jgi:hypothetical protein
MRKQIGRRRTLTPPGRSELAALPPVDNPCAGPSGRRRRLLEATGVSGAPQLGAKPRRHGLLGHD